MFKLQTPFFTVNTCRPTNWNIFTYCRGSLQSLAADPVREISPPLQDCHSWPLVWPPEGLYQNTRCSTNLILGFLFVTQDLGKPVGNKCDCLKWCKKFIGNKVVVFVATGSPEKNGTSDSIYSKTCCSLTRNKWSCVEPTNDILKKVGNPGRLQKMRTFWKRISVVIIFLWMGQLELRNDESMDEQALSSSWLRRIISDKFFSSCNLM